MMKPAAERAGGVPLMRIAEAGPAGAGGFAFWALGFRPFYLGAGVLATLSIALWGLQVAGLLPGAYLAGPVWHAHEMLFGFALAVVVGFLFTAGHNWTGLPTPTGRPLAALFALWAAGRVLVLTPFGTAAALVNVAFPFASAVALAVPFIRAGNRRNYFFIALLALLGVAQGLFHVGALGFAAVDPSHMLRLGLDVLLFIVAVMGGRVIPMFSNNGVPGTDARRVAWLEKLALSLLLALLAADVVAVPPSLLAALASAAAGAHAARLSLWHPWRVWRNPLVWVLHLAYAWIPVHLALRAAAALDWIAPGIAIHALTTGAIGGMIIGMMTRTARGHTGRPLKADRFEVACYALVALAAALRVVLPLLWPAAYTGAMLASSIAWSAGFGLFAWRYWPVLTRARVDGRPG